MRDAEAPERAARPFDPWRYRGLAAPLAERIITQAGGYCLAGASADEPLRVEFTLDQPAPERPVVANER